MLIALPVGFRDDALAAARNSAVATPAQNATVSQPVIATHCAFNLMVKLHIAWTEFCRAFLAMAPASLEGLQFYGLAKFFSCAHE